MSRPPPPAADVAPPSAADLRLLVEREKKAQDKREHRARQAQAKAQAATAPNPDGYVVPTMPAGLLAQRQWLRAGHDAYSARRITLLELTEMRRSVSVQCESYKAGAIVRQSFAAQRAAGAQERMAEVLASVEHGGAAVMLLSRLREGLTDGRTRPLPRAVPARLQPTPAEPA